jgi:hypothetical protein
MPLFMIVGHLETSKDLQPQQSTSTDQIKLLVAFHFRQRTPTRNSWVDISITHSVFLWHQFGSKPPPDMITIKHGILPAQHEGHRPALQHLHPIPRY